MAASGADFECIYDAKPAALQAACPAASGPLYRKESGQLVICAPAEMRS